MKVVIAIDSLKGSLSSIEAGMAIREGVLRAKPECRSHRKTSRRRRRGHYGRLIEGMNGEADRSGPSPDPCMLRSRLIMDI